MAAGGLKEVDRRIKSVKNTQQITRAMKMVAAAKLRKAELRAKKARDYFEQIQAVTRRAVSKGGAQKLVAPRTVQRKGFVIITSARGLAGPYNANVLRQAVAKMQEVGGKNAAAFAIGRKGRDYLAHRNIPILQEFLGVGDDPTLHQAQAIAREILQQYLGGEVDEVWLTYTKFINPLTHEVRTLRVLPVEEPPAEESGAERSYVFEPDPETVFNDLLPRYVEVVIFSALLESKASEHGARMTAMDSASKNADELIRQMILMRNRLRQAAITREIAELVSGAEALE
ncbi:ATP synthase F1 subunit gamma [Sulfobacillus sp. hq2]|uniref:ATP synthase gamma chain n=1 Tax=Sulfobacillus thermotolerans TaxID=338644 RepID=A0ABM6RTQ9_9FIRM|nr:ATP synthase F1 subunit gamma [Sulfobacillus sp. hq2]AUW94744.1 ATP synthase F1 subunit gamma [Sulfobacillus thermotolerans]MCY0908021.1 ATP synthase F1 subunit gamma [Sulfobacillus thermotolerans]POB09753.1 ATP synthase F1 subunit gamma [Sulfobacillus sp. hq2]